MLGVGVSAGLRIKECGERVNPSQVYWPLEQSGVAMQQ